MPEQSPGGGQDKIGYRKLLASLPPPIVRHASLRLSAVLGAAGFAAFSTFRATLALHLPQKPIELGRAAVGLFGLGSVPGALTARYSGRLTDPSAPTPSTSSPWRPPASPASSSCSPTTPWWPS
ncbi:hypothetical protein ACWEO4_42010 [Streptomyces sp. NPDC004393]